MDKIQRYRGLIDSKIQFLISLGSNEETSEDDIAKVAQTIKDLETVLLTYGLSVNNISNLIQLIVDPSNLKVFRNSFKSLMIKCLYPINPVSNDIIIKVIGCIGINSVKRKRKEFIHKNLQTKLIRWLYLNIAISNVEGFEILKKLTPMIFNLIDIDYTIQWITCIIFKIIIQFSGNKAFIKNLVKSWRLNLLISLNEKTNDPYLLFLIVFFQDLLVYTRGNYMLKISNLARDKRITTNVFKYPSLRYLRQLIAAKTINGDSLNLDDNFVENLAFSLQTFDTFKKMFLDKKRKLNADTENFTDLISLINSKDDNLSIVEFIDHYDQFSLPVQLGLILFKFADLRQNVIDIGEDLEIPTIDTSIYRYLFLVQRNLEEINEWCEVVLVDDDNVLRITERNSLLVTKILKGIINIQTLLGKTFKISLKILQKSIIIVNETDQQVAFFYKMLSQSPLNNDLVDILKTDNGWCQEANSVCQTLRALVEVFNNTTDNYGVNEVYSIVLSKVTDFLLKADQAFVITISIEVLNFLKFMTKMPFAEIEISNLILPPGLCYLFLMSGNPIVISETCKHISFSKNYFAEYYTTLVKEKDDESIERIIRFKDLHNSYVMDICNLFWRDKLFEYRANSSSKSMLLPHKFINTLPNLTMTIEDDLQIEDFFKKSYSIFLNLLFSSIMMRKVRELEDLNQCDIRLEGPIEESNFNHFKRELGAKKWIPVENFQDFKVILLRELDKSEFNGVSRMLFSSLKSLLNKR